jgi:hypothetical protein
MLNPSFRLPVPDISLFNHLLAHVVLCVLLLLVTSFNTVFGSGAEE